MTRLRRLAVGAVLAALLAACSSETSTRPLPAGVRPGGTLTVGILGPRSVAPWLTSALDPYGSLVVATMCDQMLDIDPETGELTSSIASDWRLQSGSSMTVQIRRDARFPDGSKVTSADVADSLSRAALAEVASPVAGVLKPLDGFDVLSSPQSEQETDDADGERLAGIRVTDATAIEVALAEGIQRPDAFRFLAHPIASVVPSRAFADDAAAQERNPSCVGPYRLAEPWQPGDPSLRLLRSPGHVAKDHAYTIGGRGIVDEIEFRVFSDREEAYAAYLAGAVDVSFVPAPKAAEARSRLGADLVEAPTPTVELIGLPTHKAPFDRPEVRRALSLAIDREAVVRAVGGTLRPLGRFLPPTLGDAFTKDVKSGCRVAAPPRADVDGAKRLLADAGVQLAGTSVRLLFNDEFANRAIVAAVAEQWERNLGLHVEQVGSTWQKLVDDATGVSGLGDPFRLSWIPELSDPSEYLLPLFSSSSIGSTNWSKFQLRPFDYLVAEQANGAVDDGERRADLLAAENLLCDLMPMIPVAEGGIAYAVRQERIGSASGRFTDRATGALLLRELFVKGG